MRFSTLLGYFINNEIIMMLIVGKNHRARFQISGGLLCSVVHRIVIDVFFQASYNAQGCQNFQKKNIYVKKKSKKKRCLFAHSFYFLPAILRYHCHFFVFVFVFLVICKKRMASALLAPALLVSRKSRIFTRFFYLKSSLGSLIGMCTNSRFFWQVLSSVFALGSASRTLFSEILIWCYQWIKDYLYLFHVTYTPTANSVLRSVYRGKEQVSRYEEEEGDMYREKEQVPRYEEEEDMNREEEQVPRYEEEDYIWIRGKE